MPITNLEKIALKLRQEYESKTKKRPKTLKWEELSTEEQQIWWSLAYTAINSFQELSKEHLNEKAKY